MWLKLATANSLIQKIQSEARRCTRILIGQLKAEIRRKPAFWWKENVVFYVDSKFRMKPYRMNIDPSEIDSERYIIGPKILFQIKKISDPKTFFIFHQGAMNPHQNEIVINFSLNPEPIKDIRPSEEKEFFDVIYSTLVHELKHFVQIYLGTLNFDDYSGAKRLREESDKYESTDESSEIIKLKKEILSTYSYYNLKDELEAEASAIYSRWRGGMSLENSIKYSIEDSINALMMKIYFSQYLNDANKQNIIDFLNRSVSNFTISATNQMKKDFPLIAAELK